MLLHGEGSMIIKRVNLTAGTLAALKRQVQVARSGYPER